MLILRTETSMPVEKTFAIQLKLKKKTPFMSELETVLIIT